MAKRKPTAKRILADKDGHACVTRAEIIAQLKKPTTRGRQKIQEAEDSCTKCADLVKALKENY